MDFADVLDMMDDDCDIQGFPNESQSISREEVESQFVTRDEFESLLKRFRHLIQSNFIRSFDEVEPRTGAYKRDISEADASTGWISVNEGLPEPDREVLLIAHGWKERLLYIGCLHRMSAETSWLTGITSKESEWLIYGWSYLIAPTVTHWRPLPTPPKS